MFVNSPFKQPKTYLKLKSSFQFCCLVAYKVNWVLSQKYLQDPIQTLIPWVISHSVPFSLMHALKTDVLQPFLLSSHLFLPQVKFFLIVSQVSIPLHPLRIFFMHYSTLWTLVLCWCECSVYLSVICMSSSVYK